MNFIMLLHSQKQFTYSNLGKRPPWICDCIFLRRDLHYHLRIPAIHGAKTTKNQTPLAHLAKKLSLRFLKDGLATDLLSQTCKGGLIFSGFSTMYSRYP